jgi:uncharacterized membrane protein YczE
MIRKIEFTPKNIFLYFFGVFILGFGAVSGTSSDLGAGAWDTVSKNLADAMRTEFGYASWIIAATLMLIVMIGTKDYIKAFMLLPAALVSGAILFWDKFVYGHYVADSLTIGIPLFIAAMFFIPMGLAMIVASNFPAFVFDELTIMLMKIFRTKSLSKIRIGIEILGLSLGSLIALLSPNIEGLGVVGFGSIIISITIGPLIAFYLKVLKVYGNEPKKD